ncbi:MAG: hypothetical protein ACPGSE_00225 [Synechococcus sp.]
MPEIETWTFALGADQSGPLYTVNTGTTASGITATDITTMGDLSWQDRLRQRLVNAWCVVTDHEVLGPYESFEEADGLLNEGMAGDVFQMRYH